MKAGDPCIVAATTPDETGVVVEDRGDTLLVFQDKTVAGWTDKAILLEIPRSLVKSIDGTAVKFDNVVAVPGRIQKVYDGAIAVEFPNPFGGPPNAVLHQPEHVKPTGVTFPVVTWLLKGDLARQHAGLL